MCKESLINYLSNEISEVEKKDFEQLLQMGEFTRDYDSRLFVEYKKGEKIGKDDWGLPRNLLKNVENVDKALANVKVADPAIGSGAFPLGMLTEIVKARSILTEYMLMHEFFRLEKEDKKSEFFDLDRKIRRERSLYNLKLETIENSLFGVDIEPSAVDIAKLRLWLSIVVDSPNDDIQPLPNLDFNLMVGNSLLDEFEGIKLFDEKLLDKEYSMSKLKNVKTGFQLGMFEDNSKIKENIMESLEKLHRKFFAEKDTEQKKKIKNEIELSEWQLIRFTLENSGNSSKIKELEALMSQKRKPYFLWKLEFAKVFQERGGFDIVIGNPPYVSLQKLKATSEILKRMCYSTFNSRTDLYAIFFEKGIELLKKKGNLNYITSNKWMRAGYGKELREFFIKRTNPLLLVDFGQALVFETAVVHSNIFLTEKTENKNRLQACTFLGNFKNISITETVKDSSNILTDLSNGIWNITSVAEKDIKDKVEKEGLPLKKWELNILRGILTGFNEAFIISKDKKEELEEADEKNKELIKPILRGRDVRKYFCEFKELYLINTHNGYENSPRIQVKKDYPKIYDYLNQFKENLEKRYDKGEHWSNLRNCAYLNDLNCEKIMFSEIVSEPQFYYDTKGYYPEATSFFITGKNLKYILALLNSKTVANIFSKFYAGGELVGKFRYKKAFLNELPIPVPTKEIEEKIVGIVEKIIIKKNNDINFNINEYEFEINEIVLNLYKFTEEEKEVVRNFGK